MWILKEHKDNDGNIISVDIELEQNETEEMIINREKKYYPNCKFNFTSPTHQTGFTYHKVENIYPHVNIINLN